MSLLTDAARDAAAAAAALVVPARGVGVGVSAGVHGGAGGGGGGGGGGASVWAGGRAAYVCTGGRGESELHTDGVAENECTMRESDCDGEETSATMAQLLL
jgi:hypothetical protein